MVHVKKIILKIFQESTEESKNGIQLDNRWVVPYNIGLVTKYNAHINVEICNSILAIKYLYKYIYKGHDRATITLSQTNGHQISDTPDPVDEIKMYLDARYISASESIWRIFHYRMHNHTPNIQRLAIHLPNQQSVTFQDGNNLQYIVNHAANHMTT